MRSLYPDVGIARVSDLRLADHRPRHRGADDGDPGGEDSRVGYGKRFSQAGNSIVSQRADRVRHETSRLLPGRLRPRRRPAWGRSHPPERRGDLVDCIGLIAIRTPTGLGRAVTDSSRARRTPTKYRNRSIAGDEIRAQGCCFGGGIKIRSRATGLKIVSRGYWGGNAHPA